MFFEKRHTCCVTDGIWESLIYEIIQKINNSNLIVEFYHRGTINTTGKRCDGDIWKNYRRDREKRYVNYNKLSEIIYLFQFYIAHIIIALRS